MHGECTREPLNLTSQGSIIKRQYPCNIEFLINYINKAPMHCFYFRGRIGFIFGFVSLNTNIVWSDFQFNRFFWNSPIDGEFCSFDTLWIVNLAFRWIVLFMGFWLVNLFKEFSYFCKILWFFYYIRSRWESKKTNNERAKLLCFIFVCISLNFVYDYEILTEVSLVNHLNVKIDSFTLF